MEQLANCISQIPDMDISDLDYAIHCRIPGERRFRRILNLPLAMALIASYIQKDIPGHHMYVGEVDLLRRVREIPDQILTDLHDALEAGEIRKPVRLFLPKESAELVRATAAGITVVACDQLDDAVYNTWPELRRG